MPRSGNLRAIWRFEVRYQLRRPATWFLGIAYVLLPVWGMLATADASGWLNSPLNLATGALVATLIGLLGTAAMAGDAGTRDDLVNIESLMFTAPITKFEYLGGRLAGVLTVNAMLIPGILVGLVVAMFMPYDDGVVFGPSQWRAFVEPVLILALPTTLVAAVVFFAMAAVTRRVLPMYLIAFIGGIAYVNAAEYLGSIAGNTVAVLIDPLGFTPVRQTIAFWTPVQRDTQLIGFPVMLVVNRLFWIGMAAVVFALLHRRFSFQRGSARGRGWFRRKQVTEPADFVPAPAALIAAARTRGTTDGRSWRQLVSVTRRATFDILANRLFLVLAAGAVFVTIIFGMQVGSIVFDTSTWPVTHLMAGEALTAPMQIMMSLLVTLFAGELVWRDRDTGMSALTAAAPVPEWVSLAGRFFALLAMIIVLQAVMMITGIGIQLAQGYYNIELDLYIEMLFGIALVNYLLFAVFAFTVHVLVDHKALGHAALAIALVLLVVAGPWLGIRHHLLLYGTDPGWTYSDLSRYGPFIGPFLWFKLYWAGWAIVLGVIAALFWRRFDSTSWRARFALARTRFRGTLVRATIVGVTIIVGAGGWIFYNTNILNAYEQAPVIRGRVVEYERRYGQYVDLPQPTITAADLRVELQPAERRATIVGTYSLVNLSGRPVEQVHVRTSREVVTRSLGLDRDASLTTDDAELRYRIYTLAAPLAPGDSLRLDFDVEFAPRGFPNSGIPTAVTANGAYFDRRWMPVIGYQTNGEMDDPKERTKAGLPARPGLATRDDTAALAGREDLRNADLVQVRAVIGTDEDQIAVTAGRLVREWKENDRRYFEYRTDTPLSFGTPFLSGRFAVREDKWRDVDLRIYHHPAHDMNLDRMVRAMQVALEEYSTAFGPYAFPDLWIVEFPRYANFARAHPRTIAFSEGSAFLTRIESWDVDRTFFVVAHETAHQWWGHQIHGARVEGAAMLSETLAQYSAMLALEREFDPQVLRRFYAFEMNYYLSGRGSSNAPERPLARVGDQSWVYYRKGSVVMWTLRERLGADRVNAALKNYLSKYRGDTPPFPTTHDLYRELEAQTPDSLRGLLNDLVNEVTVWDLRADSARVDSLPNGRWKLTLDVSASKTHGDTMGVAHNAPLDDWVEIGAFGEDAMDPVLDAVPGEVHYLARHRIRSGAQRIVVELGARPKRAGIDPYRRYIDLTRRDNLVSVR